MNPPIRTISEFLQNRAESDARRTAFAFLENGEVENSILSFADLDAQAQSVCAELRARCPPGGRAILLYPAGLEFAGAMFGCLYAGVIAVPAPIPRRPADVDQLRSIIGAVEPCCILTVSKQLDLVARRMHFAASMLCATDLLPPQTAVPVSSRPDDTAYIQFTSGSTRFPRGVVVSHGNLIHNLAYIDADFRHTGESVAVLWLPNFHDMGLVYGVFEPVFCGYTAYLMSPGAFIQQPFRWLRAISRLRATHSGGPDFAYGLCTAKITEEVLAGIDLSCWQIAFNGAEPVYDNTMEAFQEKFGPCGFRPSSFYPAYGLAEATLKVAGSPWKNGRRAEGKATASYECPVVAASGAVGHGMAVSIVDPQSRRRLGEGDCGEIWVSGPSVARGYWNNHADTKELFEATLDTGEGPFLRTGDLGLVRDARLYVTGRLKDLIIIRGRNYYAHDIEYTATGSHRALAGCSAAVFSVPPGERVVIVHEVDRHRRESHAYLEIAVAIRSAVAATFEIAVHEVLLVAFGTIPKTSSGKIRRQQCRASWLAGELELVFDLPESQETLPEDTIDDPSSTRRRVNDLLERVLKSPSDSLPPDATLIEVGMDSLRSVELQQHIKDAFDLDLSPEVLQRMTVSSLVDVCGGAAPRATSAPVTATIASSGTEAPASGEQQRLWFLDRLMPERAHLNLYGAIRISGDLRVNVLQIGLEHLQHRHEMLRVRFVERRNGLYRQTQDVQPIPVPILDFSGIPNAEHEKLWSLALADHARLPFRLDAAPLFRVILLRIAPQSYVLSVVVHHIIADAHSIGVFFRDLLAFYSAHVEGASLPPAGDMLRPRTPAQPPAESVEFWKRQLQEDLPAMHLPLDRGREPGASFEALALPVRFSEEMLDHLQAFCRRKGATEFRVLATACIAALCRMTGQKKGILGFPVSGRWVADDEHAIGLFSYPLPFCYDAGETQSFEELFDLQDLRLGEWWKHRAVPFAQAIESARRSDKSSHAPLMPVLFTTLEDPLEMVDCGRLESAPFEMGRPAMDLDIAITLLRGANGLGGAVNYRSELFNEVTIRRFTDDFVNILSAGTRNPGLSWSAMFDDPPSIRASARPVTADRIVVAATFFAELLQPAADYCFSALDRQLRIQLAPFNQVFQQLLAPTSLLRSTRGLPGVVLLRLEDWVRVSCDQAWPEDAATRLRRTADDFVTAMGHATSPQQRFGVFLLPPSSSAMESAGALIRSEEHHLVQTLSRLPFVEAISHERINTWYPVKRILDEFADREAAVPYTEEYFAAVGMVIARFVDGVLRPPLKAIVVECDDTVWTGRCGREKPAEVLVDSGRIALQLRLLEEQQAGILLCLCSRNNWADVAAVFAQRPSMPLRMEHFAEVIVSLAPGVPSLRALADRLNPGGVVFIDGTGRAPREIAEQSPQVHVFELPRESEEAAAYVKHLWCLDRWKLMGDVTENSTSAAYSNIARNLRSPADVIDTSAKQICLDIERLPELTATQKQLIEIFTEVIGGEVSLETDFMGTGAQSLAAVKLLLRVREAFDVDLPLEVILSENATLRQLAELVDGMAGSAKQEDQVVGRANGSGDII